MKHLSLACLLASLASAAAAAPAASKKYQCWTDKDGQRMCGDRVPQEYVGGPREVIKDGRVVDTVEGRKTAEQLAEDERKKKEVEEQRRQAEYDKALIQTYRSSTDIVAMRDERIALIDSRIASGEKNQADTDKGLTDLRARAEGLKHQGKPVPEKLAKQIRQFEKASRQNLLALERARAERQSVQQRFDGDLARYNAMRGLPPDTGLPKPKPKPAESATANAAPAKPAN